MLDDVLEIIKRNGSILTVPLGIRRIRADSNRGLGQPSGRFAAKSSRRRMPVESRSSSWKKSNRLDKNRRELVNQMRREAVRLLTQ